MEKVITLFNASEIDKSLVLNKLMDFLSFIATGYETTGYEETYDHVTQARFTIRGKRIAVVASRTNEEIGSDAFEQLEEYVRGCDVLVTASKTGDGTFKAIESFAIKSNAELILVSSDELYPIVVDEVDEVIEKEIQRCAPVAELMWKAATNVFSYLSDQG